MNDDFVHPSNVRHVLNATSGGNQTNRHAVDLSVAGDWLPPIGWELFLRLLPHHI